LAKNKLKMKKYICRHCGKKYHSIIEANLCFDLDMAELSKKQLKKLIKNGTNNNQTIASK